MTSIHERNAETSSPRAVLRGLVSEEVRSVRSALTGGKRAFLVAAPFWVVTIALIMMSAIGGVSAAIHRIADTSVQAEVDAIALSVTYLALVVVSALMFILALEKTWTDLLDARYYGSSSDEGQGLISRMVFTIIAFRFFKTSLFSGSPLLSLALFGATPLVALGLLFDAPWYSYPLLLLALLLFSVIPSASGVLLAALLSKVTSTRNITALFGAINFFLVLILLVVLTFGMALVLPLVSDPMAEARSVLRYVVPLSVTVTAVKHFLAGDAQQGLVFLIGTLGFAIVLSGMGLLLTQRLCSGHLDGLLAKDGT